MTNNPFPCRSTNQERLSLPASRLLFDEFSVAAAPTAAYKAFRLEPARAWRFPKLCNQNNNYAK